MPEELAPALPPHIDTLVRKVLESACEQGLRLATAESCTGGLLASLLTDVSGSSHAFERGFVVYTDEAKTEMLSVSKQLIERETAVSEQVARAMAEGGLRYSRADLCVSITGYAGAAGEDDPAGLVHFALAERRQPTRHVVRQFADTSRAGVRLGSIGVALELLEAALADTQPAF